MLKVEFEGVNSFCFKIIGQDQLNVIDIVQRCVICSGGTKVKGECNGIFVCYGAQCMLYSNLCR